MNANTLVAKFNPSRSAMGTLVAVGLTGAVLFAAGPKDYPALHTILDTGMFLLTGILALLLWDMGGHINNPLPKHLAVSFAVAALLNFFHVITSVELSGPLLPIAQSAGVLRPGTWGPAVHVLPIGVGCSVWWMRRNGNRTWRLGLGLLGLSAGLLILFTWLPRYAPPGWLGITRPFLILSPWLWLAVGWQCWRQRAADRILPVLALMSPVLLLANGFMLYSRSPHDMPAMEAHLFRIGGYLTLLVSLIQMAALDMRERIRAERELAQLNQGLEQRVLDRTARLETSLKEIGELKTALDEHAIVAITDPQGKITYVNDKFCAISKYAREELLGQDHRIINSSHHPKAFIRDLWTTIARGQVWHGEIKNKAKDGSYYWVDTTIVPFLNEQGKPRQYVAIRADITERKRTEEQLISSLKEVNDLKSALDEHAIVAITDPQGKIIYVNDKFCAISKYACEELLGQDHRIINSSHHPKEFIRGLWTTIARGKVWKGEIKNKAKDGSYYWVDTTIVPFLSGDGKPRQYVAIRADITERKRTEEQLISSLKEVNDLKSALDEHAIVAITDPQGKIIYVNDKFCAISKYAREELLGQDHRIINSSHHPKEFIRDLWTTIARGKVWKGEIKNKAKDGSYYWVDTTIVPFLNGDGKPRQYVAIRADITERKRAEDALKKQASLLDLAHDSIFVRDLDSKIIYWNQGAAAHYGWTAGEIYEKVTHDLLKTLFPIPLDEINARLYELGHWEGELIHTKRDGSLTTVASRWALQKDADGNPLAILEINNDITERKAAEEKAQAQLARLALLNQITRATGERQDLQSIFQVVIRSLEDNLPVDFSCICIYDQPANALTVVRVGVKSEPTAMELAMAEQATIPIDENGLSRCVRGQLVYEPDISEVPFPFPQRLARGGLRALVIAPLLVESKVFGVLVAARRRPQGFISGECEFLKQLSEHVALASHQSQLYSALQRAYDDLRQTQQAVMQQERLRALGQMASGIAHDINNAISPVSLYTESLLETEPNLSPRGRGYLETIAHAIDDVAQTVARMREFYRQRVPQLALAPVNLNQLVQQVVDLSRARWNDMPQQRGIVIKMATDLPAGLPAIMGVESEIREALINLIFNGVDALPEGGTLTLRTKVVESAPGSQESPAVRHIQVEVADTGLGMDEDTRRRCLEPFFTTKGERGTGLGLAMVYGMIKRHSADIEIESAVGKGTTVRLSFAVPTTPVIDTARPVRAGAIQSRLHLLVVDDDPLLIKSLRDALEADGHRIVAANGGQAGIDAFHEAMKRNEPFAAVITDLGMPYVDGRKVASAVKAASSATPVILLTGWGQRLVSEGDVPSHVDCVLNKPPKLHDLRAALAEVTA